MGSDQQPETGGRTVKSGKHSGFIDQSGRVIPGLSVGSKHGIGKAGGVKGPSSLLRGGIPSGAASMSKKGGSKLHSKASQLSELQRLTQQKKAAEESKDAADDAAAKNDGFYGMDELAEILGISGSEFTTGHSRAHNQAH